MKNDTEIVLCPPYNAYVYIHMHAYMCISLCLHLHIYLSHIPINATCLVL